ncbi:MAG: N-acetyltransferase [Nitrospinales bacterium]
MFRKARHGDIDAIVELVNRYAEQDLMLFRTPQDVLRDLEHFLVMEEAGQLVATCHLRYGWDRLVEIRSLAVHPDHYRRGLGSALVRQCIERARGGDVDKIFVLTYAMPLFAKLGFEETDKDALPLKVWTDCQGCRKRDHCDETAMILDLHPAVPAGQKEIPQPIGELC